MNDKITKKKLIFLTIKYIAFYNVPKLLVALKIKFRQSDKCNSLFDIQPVAFGVYKL